MFFSDNSDLRDTTRKAIGLLVNNVERRVGSRDVAYNLVAKEIARSPSWVKQTVLSDDFVWRPRAELIQNIKSAYDRLCARVEEEHRAELKKIAHLKGEINAAAQGFVELSMRADSTRAGRKGSTGAAPQVALGAG